MYIQAGQSSPLLAKFYDGFLPGVLLQFPEDHQSSNFDVRKGKIQHSWFKGGRTNIAYNCLDRFFSASLQACCGWADNLALCSLGVLGLHDLFAISPAALWQESPIDTRLEK